MDLGFRASGYKIICAIDKEEWACDTLRKNHPGTKVMGPPGHSGNINNINAENIYDFCNMNSDELDVIIGGPPCQPFSQAATQRFLSTDPRYKRKGFEDLDRGTLLFDFVRLTVEIQPRVFVLENVPGIASVDGGEQLKSAMTIFRKIGYQLTQPQIVEAADFGVPQYRRRLILWGSKKTKAPTLPIPPNSPSGDLFTDHYKTVAHALAGMPQDLPNHIPRKHRPESIERYRRLSFGQREKLGRVDRLDPFKPSKTVIAGGSNGGGRSHLHPFIARTLTVRECARLQSFCDDYIFEGTMSRQFTQVGNAVPPLLAEHIARHIMHVDFDRKIKGPLKHGSYLKRVENLPELVDKLFEESKKSMPKWIYFNHSNAASILMNS